MTTIRYPVNAEDARAIGIENMKRYTERGMNMSMKSALRNPAQSKAANDAVNAIKEGWRRGGPPFGIDPELMLAFNMGVDWAEKELGKQVGRRSVERTEP